MSRSHRNRLYVQHIKDNGYDARTLGLQVDAGKEKSCKVYACVGIALDAGA